MYLNFLFFLLRLSVKHVTFSHSLIHRLDMLLETWLYNILDLYICFVPSSFYMTKRPVIYFFLIYSNEFSKMVAEEYLKFFVFTGMTLDQALRFVSFRLILIFRSQTQENAAACPLAYQTNMIEFTGISFSMDKQRKIFHEAQQANA